MRVADLRLRVLAQVTEVAHGGDEAATIAALDHARVTLSALMGLPEDQDVDLQEVTVGLEAAARILRLHTDSLLELVRQGTIATSRGSGGEETIALPELLRFTAHEQQHPSAAHASRFRQGRLDDWSERLPPQSPGDSSSN